MRARYRADAERRMALRQAPLQLPSTDDARVGSAPPTAVTVATAASSKRMEAIATGGAAAHRQPPPPLACVSLAAADMARAQTHMQAQASRSWAVYGDQSRCCGGDPEANDPASLDSVGVSSPGRRGEHIGGFSARVHKDALVVRVPRSLSTSVCCCGVLMLLAYLAYTEFKFAAHHAGAFGAPPGGGGSRGGEL